MFIINGSSLLSDDVRFGRLSRKAMIEKMKHKLFSYKDTRFIL